MFQQQAAQHLRPGFCRIDSYVYSIGVLLFAAVLGASEAPSLPAEFAEKVQYVLLSCLVAF